MMSFKRVYKHRPTMYLGKAAFKKWWHLEEGPTLDESHKKWVD